MKPLITPSGETTIILVQRPSHAQTRASYKTFVLSKRVLVTFSQLELLPREIRDIIYGYLGLQMKAEATALGAMLPSRHMFGNTEKGYSRLHCKGLRPA
jgi:hypothetical protein